MLVVIQERNEDSRALGRLAHEKELVGENTAAKEVQQRSNLEERSCQDTSLAIEDDL